MCITDCYIKRSHLAILLEVCPHAGPISSPHENMIGEVVDARQGTSELASAGFIVVAHIGDHIIKLEHITAFMLFAQACIESNLRAVE